MRLLGYVVYDWVLSLMDSVWQTCYPLSQCVMKLWVDLCCVILLVMVALVCMMCYWLSKYQSHPLLPLVYCNPYEEKLEYSELEH